MLQPPPADFVPPDTKRKLKFDKSSECSKLPVPTNLKPKNFIHAKDKSVLEESDNYLHSCMRPRNPSEFANVITTTELKTLPPVTQSFQLNFHSFCGNDYCIYSIHIQ